MNKNLNSVWQEWLISVALVLVLPATILLGVKLLSPEVEYKNYSASHQDFFKDFRGHHKDGRWSSDTIAEREKLNQEWEQTEIFKTHGYQVCQGQFIKLMICGVLSVVLFYIGSVFVMPVVAASLMMSALILHLIYAWGGMMCPIFHGLNVRLIAILFALISLTIVVWAAYKDSKE